MAIRLFHCLSGKPVFCDFDRQNVFLRISRWQKRSFQPVLALYVGFQKIFETFDFFENLHMSTRGAVRPILEKKTGKNGDSKNRKKIFSPEFSGNPHTGLKRAEKTDLNVKQFEFCCFGCQNRKKRVFPH